MTSETIADIVREMRLHTRCSAADAFYDVTAWTKLCDRIEAAAAGLGMTYKEWREGKKESEVNHEAR